jgi:hypothetical protein
MKHTTINIGSDYTDEEREFIMAVERWKVVNHNRFPTSTQILAVAKSMGYRRVGDMGGGKLTEADGAKALRLLAEGLTQKEVGDLLGVSQVTISLLKRGKRLAYLPRPTQGSV